MSLIQKSKKRSLPGKINEMKLYFYQGNNSVVKNLLLDCMKEISKKLNENHDTYSDNIELISELSILAEQLVLFKKFSVAEKLMSKLKTATLHHFGKNHLLTSDILSCIAAFYFACVKLQIRDVKTPLMNALKYAKAALKIRVRNFQNQKREDLLYFVATSHVNLAMIIKKQAEKEDFVNRSVNENLLDNLHNARDIYEDLFGTESLQFLQIQLQFFEFYHNINSLTEMFDYLRKGFQLSHLLLGKSHELTSFLLEKLKSYHLRYYTKLTSFQTVDSTPKLLPLLNSVEDQGLIGKEEPDKDNQIVPSQAELDENYIETTLLRTVLSVHKLKLIPELRSYVMDYLQRKQAAVLPTRELVEYVSEIHPKSSDTLLHLLRVEKLKKNKEAQEKQMLIVSIKNLRANKSVQNRSIIWRLKALSEQGRLLRITNNSAINPFKLSPGSKRDEYLADIRSSGLQNSTKEDAYSTLNEIHKEPNVLQDSPAEENDVEKVPEVVSRTQALSEVAQENDTEAVVDGGNEQVQILDSVEVSKHEIEEQRKSSSFFLPEGFAFGADTQPNLTEPLNLQTSFTADIKPETPHEVSETGMNMESLVPTQDNVVHPLGKETEIAQITEQVAGYTDDTAEKQSYAIKENCKREDGPSRPQYIPTFYGTSPNPEETKTEEPSPEEEKSSSQEINNLPSCVESGISLIIETGEAVVSDEQNNDRGPAVIDRSNSPNVRSLISMFESSTTSSSPRDGNRSNVGSPKPKKSNPVDEKDKEQHTVEGTCSNDLEPRKTSELAPEKKAEIPDAILPSPSNMAPTLTKKIEAVQIEMETASVNDCDSQKMANRVEEKPALDDGDKDSFTESESSEEDKIYPEVVEMLLEGLEEDKKQVNVAGNPPEIIVLTKADTASFTREDEKTIEVQFSSKLAGEKLEKEVLKELRDEILESILSLGVLKAVNEVGIPTHLAPNKEVTTPMESVLADEVELTPVLFNESAIEGAVIDSNSIGQGQVHEIESVSVVDNAVEGAVPYELPKTISNVALNHSNGEKNLDVNVEPTIEAQSEASEEQDFLANDNNRAYDPSHVEIRKRVESDQSDKPIIPLTGTEVSEIISAISSTPSAVAKHKPELVDVEDESIEDPNESFFFRYTRTIQGILDFKFNSVSNSSLRELDEFVSHFLQQEPPAKITELSQATKNKFDLDLKEIRKSIKDFRNFKEALETGRNLKSVLASLENLPGVKKVLALCVAFLQANFKELTPSLSTIVSKVRLFHDPKNTEIMRETLSQEEQDGLSELLDNIQRLMSCHLDVPSFLKTLQEIKDLQSLLTLDIERVSEVLNFDFREEFIKFFILIGETDKAENRKFEEVAQCLSDLLLVCSVLIRKEP
eukprot:snap_masked-scaffold_5-processed-gene-10.4-mRNA-1 protein AED:1.00 eAED:1.00 QI:0/0/0/0/1/1/3/0/1367